MKKTKFLLLLTVIIVVANFSGGTVRAWTPDSLVLGPGDGTAGGPSSDNLSTNGRDAETTWKAFRWRAGGSGDIYVGAIRIQSIPSPTMVNSNDLQFAVYEDENGDLGSLKVWGNRLAYNWNILGVERHYFDLNNVVTTRIVTAGNYYWIAWRSDMTPTASENYIYFERQGSDPIPTGLGGGNGMMKRGCSVSAGGFNQIPPSGNCFNSSGLNYADNYYGWTVWTAGGSQPDLTPPASPQGLSVR